MKKCIDCCLERPVEMYHRHINTKDGLQSRCKPCIAAYGKARHQRLMADPEYRRWRQDSWSAADRRRLTTGRSSAVYAQRTEGQIAADRSRLRPQGTKVCRRCDTALPFSVFSRDVSRPDGLNNRCRGCDGVGLFSIARPLWESRGVDLACVYCPGPFEHVDHVIPAHLGGPDEAWNLLPACGTCNTSKSGTPVAEWLARTGRIHGWSSLLAWLVVNSPSPAGSERG